MTSIIPGKTATYRGRLSNPGRRSTIPDAYLKILSPHLYAARQKNTADAKRTATNNKLYDPTQQLSGSEIYSLAKSEANSAYDPAINSALQDRKAAIANDAALGERLAGYGAMQSKYLADAHEAAQTGATQLAGQLAATRTSTLDSLDADQAKDQQFVKDDAATRGADVTQGMSARLAADFSQQRQGVATNLAAQENAGNSAANGWSGLISMMQGAQAMRNQDTQVQTANAGASRELSLTQGIQDLQAKKADARVQGVQTLRQSEFEKGAAIQTLGIKQQDANTAQNKAAFDAKFKVAKLKADQDYRRSEHELHVLTQQQAHGDRSAGLRQRINDAAAKNRQAARRLDIAQGNLDNARARTGIEKTKLATADTTKGQWLPPVAQAHAISDFHRLAADPALRKLRTDGKSRKEAADSISTSDKWGKLDPALISAALDIRYTGHISPATAVKLHRAKIKVAGLGVPVRNPGTIPNPTKLPKLTKRP